MGTRVPPPGQNFLLKATEGGPHNFVAKLQHNATNAGSVSNVICGARFFLLENRIVSLRE